MGQKIQLWLVYEQELGLGNCISGDATVTFDTDDPFAVEFVFETRHGNVEWLIAVELFEQAFRDDMAKHDGGDVLLLLENGKAQIALFLVSPEGEAKIVLPAKKIRRFLNQITAIATPDVHTAYIERVAAQLNRPQ